MSSESPRLQDRRFVVLLPVKPAAVAKSRLLALGDRTRRELVLAFAADTATAALESDAVAAVLVVTEDSGLADSLTGLGAEVTPDAPTGDLNRSLLLASAEARRRWREKAVVALCADLPALKSVELSRALSDAAEQRACFVADADYSGTTMLAAPTHELFSPRFGSESRKAHLESGALELDRVDLPGLRRDVDNPDDLRAAIRLGVGPRTSRIAAGLRL